MLMLTYAAKLPVCICERKKRKDKDKKKKKNCCVETFCPFSSRLQSTDPSPSSSSANPNVSSYFPHLIKSLKSINPRDPSSINSKIN